MAKFKGMRWKEFTVTFLSLKSVVPGMHDFYEFLQKVKLAMFLQLRNTIF